MAPARIRRPTAMVIGRHGRGAVVRRRQATPKVQARLKRHSSCGGGAVSRATTSYRSGSPLIATILAAPSPAFNRAVSGSSWCCGRASSQTDRPSISRYLKRFRPSCRAAVRGLSAPSSSRISPTTSVVCGCCVIVSATTWFPCQSEGAARNGRSAIRPSSTVSGGAFFTNGCKGPTRYSGLRAAITPSGAIVTTSGRGRTYSGHCRVSSITGQRAEGRQKRQRSVRGDLIGRNRKCYSS